MAWCLGFENNKRCSTLRLLKQKKPSFCVIRKGWQETPESRRRCNIYEGGGTDIWWSSIRFIQYSRHKVCLWKNFMALLDSEIFYDLVIDDYYPSFVKLVLVYKAMPGVVGAI